MIEIRLIILNYQGEKLKFYKHSSSDKRALIMAVHSLEKAKGLKRGALVPYFKEGQEKNKVEIHTIKESE
jgi:hypothetical protein